MKKYRLKACSRVKRVCEEKEPKEEEMGEKGRNTMIK